MSLTEERLQVLKMVEEGKITAEDAARLLEALERGTAHREEEPAAGEKGRWFRVRVTDLRSGRVKLNITLPLAMVDAGLRMGARFAPDKESELVSLRDMLLRGVKGEVIKIEDEEDQERIEVTIE